MLVAAIACSSWFASSATAQPSSLYVYYVHAVQPAATCEPGVYRVDSIPESGGSPTQVGAVPAIHGDVTDIAVSPDGSKLAVIADYSTCGPKLQLDRKQAHAVGLILPTAAYVTTDMTTLTVYDLTGQAQPTVVHSQTDKCLLPNHYYVLPACLTVTTASTLRWNAGGTLLAYDAWFYKKHITVDHIQMDPLFGGLISSAVVRNLSGALVSAKPDPEGPDYVSDASYATYSVSYGNSRTAGAKILLGKAGQKPKALLARKVCFLPLYLALSPDDTSVAFIGWPPERAVTKTLDGQRTRVCSIYRGTDVAIASPTGVRVVVKSTIMASWGWDHPAWLSDGSGLLIFRSRNIDTPTNFEIWVAPNGATPRLLASQVVDGAVASGPAPA